MLRRDLSKVLLASAATATAATRTEAQTCTAPCYAQTATEAAAGITPVNTSYPPGHVYRYGTNTTPGTTPMDVALNNSIKAVGSGGTVVWPADQYLANAPILAENLLGLTIVAASGANGVGGTVIIGAHTGKAMLSLVGSNCCTVGPLTLDGSSSVRPQTGLLLGRSSAASAENHNFNGTSVVGYYQYAGLYNVASESNSYFGINIETQTAALGAVYLSQTDNFSIGGLTGSSMEDNKFFGGTLANFDGRSGSATVYLDCGIATGHIHFYSTFLIKNGGDSWIYLRLGGSDGQGTVFPIAFHHCSGETGGTAPAYGLHIHNPTGVNPLVLSAFTLDLCRFQTPATYNIFTDAASGGDVQLQGCVINTPYNLGSGGVPTLISRCVQCTLNLQFESAITLTIAFGCLIWWNQSAPTISNNAANNMIFNAGGTLTLPPVGLNGVPAPPQVTGWGTPTGSTVVNNFPGGAATLNQTSAAVAEIISSLKNLGLFGA